MAAVLVRNTLVAAAGVVLFATRAAVPAPVIGIAVFVAIPVVAAVVAGTEGDADTRRVNAYAAKIDIDVGGAGQPGQGAEQGGKQDFFGSSELGVFSRVSCCP